MAIENTVPAPQGTDPEDISSSLSADTTTASASQPKSEMTETPSSAAGANQIATQVPPVDEQHPPPDSITSTSHTQNDSPGRNRAAPRSVDDLPPEAIALATRFFDAARNGQMDIFEQALPRGLSPNLTNGKGDSLIMLSSYHGHAPLVKLLLAHGADPNRLNDRGQSPLAGVIFKNERDCFRELLDGKADPRIGRPNALEACEVFKMDELKRECVVQVDRLERGGG